MISQGAQPILTTEKTMDSSIWRSILFFIALMLFIGVFTLVFLPWH
jgi:hypothetical protein